MDGPQRTLLFIDDDEYYIYFMRKACKNIDSVSRVLGACNGQDALEKLEAWLNSDEPLPDIMFVDINMPRMDGFEFLQAFIEMREKYPALNNIYPLLMLTSSNDETDRARAAQLGVVDFIVKPDDIAEAREMITRIISE